MITTKQTKQKDLVLFKNHKKTKLSDYLLQKLYNELDSNEYDIIELYDATDKDSKTGALNFTHNNILDLGYKMADNTHLKYFKKEWLPETEKSKQIWYNAEYPLFYAIDYIQKNFSEIMNTNYKNIWSIEYDVYFSGNWNDLFKQYEKDDTAFIGPYNTYYPASSIFPEYWDLIDNEDIIKEDRANSFGCIYRVAGYFFNKVRVELETNRHHSYCEQTFISLAKHLGMSIKDFNEKEVNYQFATLNGNINQNLKNWIVDHNQTLKNNLFHPIRDFDIIKCFEKVED
jgi:hypothetical protein